MNQSDPITEHLKAWQGGDDTAWDQMTPMVYRELRGIAGRLFQRELDGHTLQPTALVHEAFPAIQSAAISWQDRAHFFAGAARILRHVLIDHARAKNAQKRGGGLEMITLNEDLADSGGIDCNMLDLDRALLDLAEMDARKAELIELRIFGGLEIEEIAEVASLSISTVQREIRFVKAWLSTRLGE